jgi:hypothetical protein
VLLGVASWMRCASLSRGCTIDSSLRVARSGARSQVDTALLQHGAQLPGTRLFFRQELRSHQRNSGGEVIAKNHAI